MVSFMFKALTVLTFGVISTVCYTFLLRPALFFLLFFCILFSFFGDTMLLFGKDYLKPHEGSLALKERTALYSTLDL